MTIHHVHVLAIDPSAGYVFAGLLLYLGLRLCLACRRP